MSAQAVSWAKAVKIDRDALPPACSHVTVKFVLVMLADYAHSDGTRAAPSKATLAEILDVSENTVRRCLRALESLGLIEAMGRLSDRRYSATAYRLNMTDAPVSGGSPVRPLEAAGGSHVRPLNTALGGSHVRGLNGEGAHVRRLGGSCETPRGLTREAQSQLIPGNPRGARARAGAPAREAPPADDLPAHEPPRQCPRHIDDPNPPPCGACRDARTQHEAWTARRLARRDAAEAHHSALVRADIARREREKSANPRAHIEAIRADLARKRKAQ